MNTYRIEIKWALAFVAMTLCWMLLERLTGLHSTHIDQQATYTNLIAIPAIAIYVFALLDKRKNFYQGRMTYGQGFVTGLIITALITLFVPLTQYLSFTLITPDYFANAIAYAVKEGKMTQAEAESFFNLKNYLVQAFIGTPIMGTLTTAIVALFTKTKSPSALSQTSYT